MALVNMSENLVRERLSELLQHTDCCRCDTCYTDMLAIALNHVKPSYVNTLKGELFTRANASVLQNAIDTDIAIMKAIELVSQAPRHENQ